MNERIPDGCQWASGAIFICSTMIPAMKLAGYWPFFPDFSMATYLTLAIWGGGIAGALQAKCRLAGFAGGIVAAPGCLLAVYFWGINDDVMFKYEVCMMMLVGSLPGVGVYYLARWFLTGRLLEDGSEEEQSRWTPPDGEGLDEAGYANPWRYGAASFESDPRQGRS